MVSRYYEILFMIVWNLHIGSGYYKMWNTWAMFGSAYAQGTVRYASRGTENQDLSSNPTVRGLGR